MADIVLRADYRWSRQQFSHLDLTAFEGLELDEAERLLAMVKQVYSARNSSPFQAAAQSRGKNLPEDKLEVDPALLESGNELRALIDPRLVAGEKLLWAARTRVLDQNSFFELRTYALTDRRAFIVEPVMAEQSAWWENVVRVTMTRRLNGRGRLRLVLSPGESGHNHTLEMKNCPDFNKVQRLVERIYLGEDSDPDSPLETEADVAEAKGTNQEEGLPIRWRYRLEAELLPNEQLRWVGRANPRGVKKMLRGCLLWAIAPLVILPVFGLWFLALPVLAMLAITLLFGYLVLLNTAYAITDHRVMQVSGLQRWSFSRTIEFYPRLDFEQVQVGDKLPTNLSRSMGQKFADLIVLEENYYVSRRYNYPGAGRRPVVFSGIYRQDLELVKDLIRQICRRGPLYRAPSARKSS